VILSNQNEENKVTENKSQPQSENIPCDASLWEHVYHSYRLEVREECKVVTGTIELLRKEADGDYHIRLKLDSEQNNLLNEKNYDEQKGCLVLEPVCANKVTQKDAIKSCEDFVNSVYIPHIGEHVKVTGSYVLDKEHGWMEIHPVTKIEVMN